MHPDNETPAGNMPDIESTQLSPDILGGSEELIGAGAEAQIYRGEWLGLDVIIKYRQPREYREPEMDASLRLRRCRMEARLMAEARTAGVHTPVIFDIDPENSIIVMERIHGQQLKKCITPGNCRNAGVAVGMLHRAGLVHGDLTTSNMIVTHEGSICLIDFGLGEKSNLLEARGVDLHVFLEAFESTHSGRMECLEDFLESYRESWDGAAEVIERCHEITRRGRYR